jgi:phosphoglycerate dehydrogenase-like enzyme
MNTVGLLFDQETCDEAALRRQLAAFEVIDLRDWRSDIPRLAERIRPCDLLVLSKYSPTLPAELIQDPGRLKYVCSTRGVVKYVPRGLLERGIVMTNWGDAPARGVGELALGLLIACLLQLPAKDRMTRANGLDGNHLLWQAYSPSFEQLTVGVYGCGQIGSLFVRRCLALGMQVRVFDPWAARIPEGAVRVDDLDTLFRTCAAISIHVGMSDSTKHTVDARRLALLPDGGVIVNTARPGVIVEADLIAELTRRRLIAGLDVIENEGRPHESPFATLPNCILTGHGGNWRAVPPAGWQPPGWSLPHFAERNLHAFVAGKPLEHVVTLEQYDRST